jgi:N-ethylmaleimide reductase
MTMMDLLSPYKLGDLLFRNRMVMAPMTRCRAAEGNVPGPLAATYYTQRASAGLIITEGSQVSRQGVGFHRTPGIYSVEQVAGWKKVTASVHEAGSNIFLQLWHVGRMSHPDYLNGAACAPSALPWEKRSIPRRGKKIRFPGSPGRGDSGIVNEFSRARNARSGFDGVEIHGANGYLLDQFLRDGTNRRTDNYGGILENRMRFPLEVARAVVGEWGPGRVGYRLSPHFPFHAMSESDPRTFSVLLEAGRIGMRYIHLIEPVGGRLGATAPGARMASLIRAKFEGTLILNGGYDAASGNEVIGSGLADLVSFGVLFLANPDLPDRFLKNVPLNSADPATFYTGEEKGYTDYPHPGPGE